MDKHADHYARRAPEFNSVYGLPERQTDLSLLRTRLAELFAGRDVLEVACGAGYLTAVISPAARGVTALDINEKDLALARAKPLPEARVQFQRANACALPEFGRRHDALFAAFWWSHMPLARLDDFLAGCARAAAPGAMLAFLDGRFVQGSSTPISRRDAEGNSYQLRNLDDGSVQEVLKNFPTEGELIQRASRLGWGAHVELLRYHWLLTFWAPR